MADEPKMVTVENGTDQDVHVHGFGNLPPHTEASVEDSEPVLQMIQDDVLKRHNRKPKASPSDQKENGS